MTVAKTHKTADYEALYTDAETVDNEIFAEMRSNLLLISGDHWQRRHASYFKRVRDSKELAEEQKLRLTKNHVQNIHNKYCGHVLAMAPGVGFEAANDAELQDQKAAQLHHSVWLSACEKQNMDEKVDEWVDDFFGIGEVATKIFYDPSAGYIKAFEQATTEGGAPLYTSAEGEDTEAPMDEMGQPHAPKAGAPQYSGDILFEKLYGFNLLRPSDVKDLDTAPYLIIRKMVDRQALIAQFPQHEKIIVSSPDRTFVVMDGSKGGYRRTENELMLKEIYYRPCHQYPKGWVALWVEGGTLFEDELPGGLFPIVVERCNRIQTTPRGRSIVKVMRPYQIEINRTASKIAEHQVTLGDDKILHQSGTTLTPGTAMPGVRGVQYTGAAPVVMAGRNGAQYVDYMNGQIKELYGVMNVEEDAAENKGTMDPYALLYKAASQKKKFNRYVKRFERFLTKVASLYIKLAKVHFTDDHFVQVAGRKEAVNIAEFRNSDDLCYQIKVVPQSDDVETKFGKQLVLNHALQYVGNKLDSKDIGKMMRAMPYSNLEESFSDMTIDYDSATNDILALDRGEQPPIGKYDEHVYCVKRLVARMRQADFRSLDPQIQQNYEMRVQQHEELEAQRVLAIQRAEAGFIPTGGYMVIVDLYVADPANPKKTQRARIPYQSVEWLIQQLEAQGQSLQQLEAMNQGALADLAGHVNTNRGAMDPGTGPSLPPLGQERPSGDLNGIRRLAAVPA